MAHDNDLIFMHQALQLAQHAANIGEVPIGAVIVLDNEIIATGWNAPIATQDPTMHAEIMALRNAAQKLQNYRLPNATLYVTLEPCTMCVGAMLHSRIKRLVYGAIDPKGGAVESVFNILDTNKLNHKIPYTHGVLAEECGQILKDFFRARRHNH